MAVDATTRTTLLDIAKANGSDLVTGLIEESIQAHPELTMGDNRTIAGLNYRTLIRTGLPTVGFRIANEGSTRSKGVYENRLVETYIMNPRWEADKAVADVYEDGAATWMALEGTGQMEAAMRTLASQFYYGVGTGGSTKGFPGLLASVDTTNLVTDAGGTTESTCSSVWAVKFGPRDVRWVWGNNGALTPTDVRTETIYDAAGEPLDGYVQSILARPGLQVGNKNCIGRIKKLTADSGKGLTDALINSFLAKFPSGIQPDVLLMTRRSLSQLQASRTATSTTGAPAPFPTAIAGLAGQNIPIAVTDAILNTETLALA